MVTNDSAGLIIKKYKEVKDTDTIGKALSMLKNSNEILLVFDQKKKYSGILMQHGILRSDLDPEKSKIKNFKVSGPKIDGSISISECARIMLENNLLYLPVSEKNKIIGLISYEDLLSNYVAQIYGEQSVLEVMSPDMPVAEPAEKLRDVVKKFKSGRVTSLPVIENGRHRGIVYLHDTVNTLITRTEKPGFGRTVREKSRITDLPVRNIMSPPVVEARENDKISKVISTMLEHHTDCVSIVDSTHKYKGMVTVADLLKLLVTPIRQQGRARIKINSSFDEINRDQVRSVINASLDKFEGLLGEHSAEVFMKEHKEKMKHQKLIYTRIQVYSSAGRFDATAEGWGPDQSLSKTLNKLEKQMRRKKEPSKRIKQRRY
jgi:CBS-domain-containing membrane protein